MITRAIFFLPLVCSTATATYSLSDCQALVPWLRVKVGSSRYHHDHDHEHGPRHHDHPRDCDHDCDRDHRDPTRLHARLMAPWLNQWLVLRAAGELALITVTVIAGYVCTVQKDDTPGRSRTMYKHGTLFALWHLVFSPCVGVLPFLPSFFVSPWLDVFV